MLDVVMNRATWKELKKMLPEKCEKNCLKVAEETRKNGKIYKYGWQGSTISGKTCHLWKVEKHFQLLEGHK